MSAGLDLNLARTFVIIYETRSVTVAADILEVTQPTVSYALAKLRRLTGDVLFVRGAGRLVPTAEADRIYPTIAPAVRALDDTFTVGDAFDHTRVGHLSLVLSDLGEVTMLPLIVAELGERAPAADLTVTAFDLATAADRLIRGEVDVVVASPELDSAHLHRQRLFAEGYVGMVAADHPRVVTQTASAAGLARERFAVVDGSTGHPGPRRAIRELDLEDRIALRVSRFATLPYVVQSTELVAIVPDLVAALMARTHPVRTFTLPWEIEHVEVAAYTRRLPAPGPTQRWFLSVISDAMHRLPPSHQPQPRAQPQSQRESQSTSPST